MQAIDYDPAEDTREDPYLKIRAQQGIVGRVEVALLKFGLLLKKTLRWLKGAIKYMWDCYMGYYIVDGHDSGCERYWRGWKQAAAWGEYPVHWESTNNWAETRGLFDASL